MTIGDVMFGLGVVGATAATLWTVLVLSALLASRRAALGAQVLQTSFTKVLLMGVGVTVPSIMMLIVLAAVPNQAVKILALILALGFLMLSAIGSGGLVRWIADQIRASSGDTSQYGSTTRAAILLVGAVNLPILGWFLFAPLCLCMGIGLLLTGKAKPVPFPDVVESGGQ